MEVSDYDPMIVWFDNVLDVSFCRRCIRKFNKDKEHQRDGHTFGGYTPEVKQSKDLFLSDLDDWKSEDKVFFDNLAKHLGKYQEYVWDNFNIRLYTNQDSGYQIQKTVPGGFYHWHHDGHFRSPGDGRIITYLWYLNSCQDGETEFSCGERVEPRLGRLLLFPATWDRLHRGTPPKTVKYVCTGWLYENRSNDAPTE